MSLRDVFVFYWQELRSALRERNIVVYSILLPLFMYPVLMWLVFTGITFVKGQTDEMVARVALLGLPGEHESLRDRLAAAERLTVVDTSGPEFERALRDGSLDAALVFGVPKAAGTPPGSTTIGKLEVSIAYDDSKERSRAARDRVAKVVESYREGWLAAEAEKRGVGADAWQQYYVGRKDEASDREVGALLLKILLPPLLLAMIALGCFYPAIDTTAGERERSTWETTMTLGASRTSILVGKYLYVATLGALAGILNIVAMVVSIGPVFASLAAGSGRSLTFSIPFSAIPVVAIGAVLTSLFIAAAMMIAAAFARTFKEGQTMVSPFYFVILMPVFFLQSPDLEFTLPLAFVPVVNVTMVFRDAIGGVFQWPLIAITILVGSLTIALCLAVARRILQFEDVLMGSFNGSFFKFAKDRLFGRETATEEAR